MNINSYIAKFGDRTFTEVPFNEVDALIFAELSYINMDLIIKDKTSIMLKNITPKDLNPYVFEGSVDASKNKTMLSRMIKSKRYSHIIIKNVYNHFSPDEVVQFYALTILMPNRTMYLSFRGTDTTILGWKEDFGMIYQKEINSNHLAMEYTNRVVSRTKMPFFLGGHSKGGNLAFYAALNIDEDHQTKMLRAFSFDGPGFKNGIIHFPSYGAIYNQLDKYLTHRDVIGFVFNEVDNYKIVYSNGLLLGGHDPFYWQINNKGQFVYRKKITNSAIKSNERFNEWLETLTDDDKEFFINTLFVIFNGNETIYDLLRNFLSTVRKVNKIFKEKDYKPEEQERFKRIGLRLFKFYVGIDDIKRMNKRNEKRQNDGKEVE